MTKYAPFPRHSTCTSERWWECRVPVRCTKYFNGDEKQGSECLKDGTTNSALGGGGGRGSGEGCRGRGSEEVKAALLKEAYEFAMQGRRGYFWQRFPKSTEHNRCVLGCCPNSVSRNPRPLTFWAFRFQLCNLGPGGLTQRADIQIVPMGIQWPSEQSLSSEFYYV